MNLTRVELEKKFEEKYKDVELVDAAKYYYGNTHDEKKAMIRLIIEMDKAVEVAANKFEEIKENYENPHMYIFINQDTLEMIFSIAKYDDEENDGWIPVKEVHRHYVGEAMAEALVLMHMMDESKQSTGIRQAINNWIEDIDFSDFGEFDEDYSISDEWELIQY